MSFEASNLCGCIHLNCCLCYRRVYLYPDVLGRAATTNNEGCFRLLFGAVCGGAVFLLVRRETVAKNFQKTVVFFEALNKEEEVAAEASRGLGLLFRFRLLFFVFLLFSYLGVVVFADPFLELIHL